MVFATTKTFFTDVIESSHEKPVMMTFYAEWCDACKITEPILEDLESEFNDQFILVGVDIQKEKELTENFQIQNIPNFLLFSSGTIVDQISGAAPKKILKKILTPWLCDNQEQKIKSTVENQNWPAAQSYFSNIKKIPSSLLPQLWVTIEAIIANKTLLLDKKELIDLIKRYPAVGAPKSQLRQSLINLIKQEGRESIEDLIVFLKNEEEMIIKLQTLLKDFTHLYGIKKEIVRKKIIIAFQILGEKNPITIKYREQFVKLMNLTL